MHPIRKIFISIIASALITASMPVYVQAMEDRRGERHAPYGDYCSGPRWGWYGAKKEVKTTEEAEKILKEYFSRSGDIKIGRIRERERFFEAEILDRDNETIDVVIVNKRTGRIRSIY